MVRIRVLGLSILFLALLVFAMGSTRAAADPTGLAIGFEIGADGSWKVVELFGQEIVLDPQSFNSVAQVLGLGFALPAQLLPPNLVATFDQADIAQLTLALEGGAARVWLNDLQSPQVKVHLKNAQGLLPEQFAQPYAFLTEILKFVPGTVYVRFTSEPFARPEMGEFVSVAAEPVNAISVAATINPAGQVLSVGGFTREDVAPLGLALPAVDPGMVGFLAGFDKVAIDATPSELVVLTNDQPLVEVLWDADGRQFLLDTVQSFVPGLNLSAPQIAPVIDLAETWLASSHISAGVFVADSPKDALLSLEVGEPLVVTLEDGGLNVAGMTIPVAGLDTSLVKNTVQAYGINQAQVCWQGDELRWLVNGMAMPYLSASGGWLTKAIEVLGWQPLPLASKIETLLTNTELPVVLSLGPGAVAAAADCGAYRAAAAPAPAMAFGVAATWDQKRGELALEKVDLPFEAFGLLPIGITAQFQLPSQVAVFVPQALGHVEASVGASGLTASVDGVDVGLHWDANLWANLAKVADGFGFGPTLRQVEPVLRMAQVSLDVASVNTVAESR